MASMIDEEIIMRFPHSLGVYEAKRRVAACINPIAARYGKLISSVETEWDGNCLIFSLSAYAQRVDGSIEVENEFVELRARFPILIRLFGHRFMPVIRATGPKLLQQL